MKWARRILLPLIGLGAAGTIGVVAAVMAAYFYVLPGLPPAETIRDIPLQVPLRIYSREGDLITEIGEQRRIPVTYDEIPEVVVQALLAAEDDRFFEHPGIDYQGILRALWKFAISGARSQGGSTITMQLARDYFLTRDRSFIRKLVETFLAFRIEREFDKETILEMFLNKMFFGQRAYGIAAASQIFFDKPLADLNAAEAATLVGVLAAPSRYNPVSGPEASKNRRGYVLRRMAEIGALDSRELAEANAYPLESELHGPDVELEASFLAEMVRQEMHDRFGDEIYTAGYEVFTTLDGRLQRAATLALANGLLEYDRRHGYRGPLAQVAAQIVGKPGEPLGPDARQALYDIPQYSELQVALIRQLGGNNTAVATLRDGTDVVLPFSGVSWARKYIDDDTLGAEIERIDEVLSVGDLVYVIATADGQHALAQRPQVEGAFVALDPADGAVAALQGGFDYSASKFNRAVQTARQPGSTFKPFIYSAALENGFTAATTINDAPIVIESSELETVWRPINYGGRFHGPTRMREALYRSFNLVSVRILLQIGLPAAIEHLQLFGFTDSQTPRDTSLALGSGAMAPIDLAAGYATFANSGYRVEPYFIDTIHNAEGEEIFRAAPTVVCRACIAAEDSATRRQQPTYTDAQLMIDNAATYRPSAAEDSAFFANGSWAERVLDERNAWIVSDMLRDVIRRGTGVRANRLGRRDLSGKTGTSNDRRDAWFAGFNANLVATTWVGFDQDRPLGGREEGSRTALPIWIHFMERILPSLEEAVQPQPAGMVTVRVSPETGELSRPGDTDFLFETFREEFAPQPDYSAVDPDVDLDPFNPGSDDPDAADEPLF